jgi:hypothetical protein
MCTYFKGPELTVLIMLLIGSYLGISLVIQKRLNTDPLESAEAKRVQLFGGGFNKSLHYIAFIFTGNIKNPVTNTLRNIDRILICLILLGLVTTIFSDSIAARCGVL